MSRLPTPEREACKNNK